MSKYFVDAVRVVLCCIFIGAMSYSGASAQPGEGAAQPDRLSAALAAGDEPVFPNPVLFDARVRKAIAFCTDRRALAKAAYPSFTDPQIDALMSDSFISPTHWAYHSPTTKYPFNPTQGQALLQAAGWTLSQGQAVRVNAHGQPLSLVLTTTTASLRQAYAAVLENQLAACGIQLLRFHTDGSWLFHDYAGLQRRNFDLASYAWGWDEDLANIEVNYGCAYIPSARNGWDGQNFMGWCNAVASQAADIAGNTAFSHAIRKPYFDILQEEMAKDMPTLALFLRDDLTTMEHLDFNLSSPPPPNPALKDASVRKAIAYCTDRWALARVAFPTLTDPQVDALMVDSFLPSNHWAYHSPSTQYPYNPAQGQALLQAAGWTLPQGATIRVNAAGEPLSLILTTTSSSLRQAYAQVLDDQMEACGIQLLRLHVPANWLFNDFAGLVRRDFEISAFAWVFDNTENFDFSLLYGCNRIPASENGWSGQNYMGWCNLVASEAAVHASDTGLSQSERLPYAATVQEEFASDMPSLSLFVHPESSTVEHLDFNQFNLTWYSAYLSLARR